MERVKTLPAVSRRLLVIVAVVVASCLPMVADAAKDAYKRGVQAERQAHYEAAFGFYEKAHASAPANAEYFAAYSRMRFTAAQQHIRSGQLLLSTGSLPEAMAEFQRASLIDTSNFLAGQELRRVAEMIRRRERQNLEPRADSPLAKSIADVAEPVQLQPISSSLISLHMTMPADVIYRTIGKLANLNVLIDPDYKPQKIAIDLADVTLLDALDMVRLQSKTYWRPVLPNTIFVTADSSAKRKELEQNVMKTFYLQNVSTAADLQEAATLLKQIVDVSRVQLIPNQDAMVVRGTPDQLILAEKLLGDFDKPKAEVIIDVAVMQVARDKIRTLGTNLPTSTSVGLTNSSSSSSGSSSSGSIALNALGKLSKGDFAMTLGGGSLSLLASDSNSKILQSPEIRALNDEKATLRIGDRIPIATGSQSGVVGNSSSVVSTQFQYIDVGVNIDISPHIHANGEVTLKLALEISTVTGTQSIGGVTQPIIGQRRIEHETRLADGEVNLLGGILQDSDTRSLSGYPWVSKVPILKYLFAQENKEIQESEIVFAITPHIVRGHQVNEDNQRVIDIGTGGSIELRRKPPATPAEQPKAQKAAPQPEGVPAAGPASPAAPPQPNGQPKPEPSGGG